MLKVLTRILLRPVMLYFTGGLVPFWKLKKMLFRLFTFGFFIFIIVLIGKSMGITLPFVPTLPEIIQYFNTNSISSLLSYGH